MDIAVDGAGYVMPLIKQFMAWFLDDPERPSKLVEAAKSAADSLGLMPPPPLPPKPSLFGSPSKIAAWLILSVVIMAVASLKSEVKKNTIGKLKPWWAQCGTQTRTGLCAVGVVVLGVLIAIASDELCAASISGIKVAWLCDAFTEPSWFRPIVVVGASAAALAGIFFGVSWLVNVEVNASALPLEQTTSPEAVLDGVPSLPKQYQPRPQLAATHLDALLSSTGTMAITASTTGVSGPAGAGKSTTAIVLARDPQVHAHFNDGVIWLAFGRERTGAEVLCTLAGRLGVATEPGTGRQLAQDELTSATSRALDGKKTLLVLDDIWRKEQLDAFASLTAEGGLLGRLVTTRNHDLAGADAQKVDELQEEEGLRMLARYTWESRSRS